MNDIRAMLCEEIEKLRNKETAPSNVNAIVNATGKIISSIKLEIEFAKLTNRDPVSKFLELDDAATIKKKKKRAGARS